MQQIFEIVAHNYGPAGLICLFLWTLREQMKEIKDEIKEIKEELRPVPILANEVTELKRRLDIVEDRYQ